MTAADADSGEPRWKVSLETARAPLSLGAGRVYVLDSQGLLHSLDVTSGSEIWQSGQRVGGDFFNVIAAEGSVFVNDFDSRKNYWLAAADGFIEWEKGFDGRFSSSFDSIAPGYTKLYALNKSAATSPGAPLSERLENSGA